MIISTAGLRATLARRSGDSVTAAAPLVKHRSLGGASPTHRQALNLLHFPILYGGVTADLGGLRRHANA
jgi:hypothetical protein